MFSIEAVVRAVLYLIGAAAIFGILFYVVNYCESQFPNAGPFWKFTKIFLMIAACFTLIFLILGFMGHPIIRFSN